MLKVVVYWTDLFDVRDGSVYLKGTNTKVAREIGDKLKYHLDNPITILPYGHYWTVELWREDHQWKIRIDEAAHTVSSEDANTFILIDFLRTYHGAEAFACAVLRRDEVPESIIEDIMGWAEKIAFEAFGTVRYENRRSFWQPRYRVYNSDSMEKLVNDKLQDRDNEIAKEIGW